MVYFLIIGLIFSMRLKLFKFNYNKTFTLFKLLFYCGLICMIYLCWRLRDAISLKMYQNLLLNINLKLLKFHISNIFYITQTGKMNSFRNRDIIIYLKFVQFSYLFIMYLLTYSHYKWMYTILYHAFFFNF